MVATDKQREYIMQLRSRYHPTLKIDSYLTKDAASKLIRELLILKELKDKTIEFEAPPSNALDINEHQGGW